MVAKAGTILFNLFSYCLHYWTGIDNINCTTVWSLNDKIKFPISMAGNSAFVHTSLQPITNSKLIHYPAGPEVHPLHQPPLHPISASPCNGPFHP